MKYTLPSTLSKSPDSLSKDGFGISYTNTTSLRMHHISQLGIIPHLPDSRTSTNQTNIRKTLPLRSLTIDHCAALQTHARYSCICVFFSRLRPHRGLAIPKYHIAPASQPPSFPFPLRRGKNQDSNNKPNSPPKPHTIPPRPLSCYYYSHNTLVAAGYSAGADSTCPAAAAAAAADSLVVGIPAGQAGRSRLAG